MFNFIQIYLELNTPNRSSVTQDKSMAFSMTSALSFLFAIFELISELTLDPSDTDSKQ